MRRPEISPAKIARIVEAVRLGPCTSGGVATRIQADHTNLSTLLNSLARSGRIARLGEYGVWMYAGVEIYTGAGNVKFIRRDAGVYASIAQAQELDLDELLEARGRVRRAASGRGSGQFAGRPYATGFRNWPNRGRRFL